VPLTARVVSLAKMAAVIVLSMVMMMTMTMTMIMTMMPLIAMRRLRPAEVQAEVRLTMPLHTSVTDFRLIWVRGCSDSSQA